LRCCLVALLCLFELGSEPRLLQTASRDPEHETVELENEQVRVLRVRIPPGGKSVMHSHPNRVVIPLTVQRSRATTSTGSVDERDRRPGQVFWGAANTHMTENLSGEMLESLIIEIKSSQPPTATPHKR
jgi:quercetin dioxygenase-like cupin family protein